MTKSIKNDLIKCMASSVKDGIKNESCEKFADKLKQSATTKSEAEINIKNPGFDPSNFRASVASKKSQSFSESIKNPGMNITEYRDFSPSGRVR